MKAIERTGTVDSERQIVLDEPLAVEGPTRVRLIILMQEESDIGEEEWLKAAASDPAFDFLREPEEDLYTLADGRSFHDEG